VFVDDDRLRELLQTGLRRTEIAEVLGVSASTVSRRAGRLGFPVDRRRRSRFDWAAIQAFHDAGHSLRECRLRFGFSNGAWDSAVSRGDLVPHPVTRQPAPSVTRREVSRLLATGLSQAAVARELRVSAPTVSYHARRLGIPAVERSARRFDWAAIQRSYDEGLSMRECAALHGFSRCAWSAAVRRGAVFPRPRAMPLDELLGAPRNRNHIKQRLFELGLKHNVCEVCGSTQWRGRPLSLALHHVNGDGSDNRLENLQLLCPNCHSQTDNFAGRNRRRDAASDGDRSAAGGARPISR
jgi:DNA-binding CsgD family transcriptional regulator/5-methylcytosine-specific restriction endonuclease McrA